MSKISVTAFLPLLAAFAMSVVSARAQQKTDTPALATEKSVIKFLQARYHDKKTQYIAAFPDLNGDGTPEALVYLTGREVCGSGGCNLLILEKNGDSWKIVTHTTITQLPIRVLSATSHGWHNIAVWVQGGGIQPGYEAELRFNGKTYPSNPSVPPARRATKNLAGEVVIKDGDNPKPLW